MQVSHDPSNHNSQEANAMHTTTSRKAPLQGFRPLLVVMLLAGLLALVALCFGVSLKTIGLGMADVLIFGLLGTAMLRGLEPLPSQKLRRHPAGH